jgi:hypothetical protein
MNSSSDVDHRNEEPRFVGSSSHVSACREGSLPGPLRVGSLLLLLFLSTACNSTTVLLANFNSDNVGSPAASTQATGTVSLDPGAGSVTIVAAPAPALPADKWVQISHPTTPSPQTGMRGVFARFDGVGNYWLLASLYIPDGTGAVTVQFEPFIEPNEYFGFMHLDFMPEGDVRIDDGPVRFGHFPRDLAFVLSVNLVITATTATAHISLIGEGTSGSIDVSVNPSLLSAARQFGAVRFWMGFQWQGSFFVDNILVTRRNDS